MPNSLTIEDGRQSLHAHVASEAGEIRAKYGPHLGWDELLRVPEIGFAMALVPLINAKKSQVLDNIRGAVKSPKSQDSHELWTGQQPMATPVACQEAGSLTVRTVAGEFHSNLVVEEQI